MGVPPTAPEPVILTEARGVHQSDVIIRGALVEAIADLRRNPYLLDHVFASLVEDDLTNRAYGQKERDRAKQWFLRTDVPVVMDYRLDAPETVAVSVGLIDSTEAEATTGSVHYQPSESAAAIWSPLTETFVPTYAPSTGVLRLPDAVAAALVVVPGMLVVDRTGRAFEVRDTTDRGIIVLDKSLPADFSATYIKGAQPRLVTEIESKAFKESYRVACHAHGEPYLLTWLHSIVVFALLRYEQDLLEGRGFERVSVASGPFAKNESWGIENMWTRSITVAGFCRTYWPKRSVDRVLSVTASPLQFSKAGVIADRFVAQDGFTDENTPWFAQDGLGTPIP